MDESNSTSPALLRSNSNEIQELNDDEQIYVRTRTNKLELLDPNKITIRLQNLIKRHPKITNVNASELMLNVLPGIKSYITTTEIDEYSSNIAASLSVSNPHYMKLAARIIIDNHQKNTDRSFVDKMRKAYLREDKKGNIAPLVSERFFKYVEEHQDYIEPLIDYSRDFLLDFFGFKSFLNLYSMKVNGRPIERPQDAFMRVAIAIHMNTTDLEEEMSLIKQTYDALSNKYYTHGSPSYFRSGSANEQFCSCFLLGTEDSIDGIEMPGVAIAKISKWAGGIGMHVHSIRGKGALIRGTNGYSNGIVPFLRIYNNKALGWNQGGVRPGSVAIYLMPHHPDIMEFLQLKLPDGQENERARDLFYAVWLPDIFMERVRDEKMWSLFDPNETMDLSNYYNTKENLAYTNHYLQLEKDKKYVRQIKARTVWEAIYKCNKIKGMPYLCSSDASNAYSMQSNLGTIKSSNLCSEIIEYSDINEYAVCVLASISLPSFIIDSYTAEELAVDESTRRQLNHEFPLNPIFDAKKLIDITKLIVTNLNNIIDKNYYPVIEAKRSNQRHRPLGIGIQGLADAYLKMRLPFDSPDAHKLNKLFMETIYYAALSQSTRLCREGYQRLKKQCEEKKSVTVETFKPNDYETHHVTYTDPNKIPKDICAYPSMKWTKNNNDTVINGSPISRGIFHWELYDVRLEDLLGNYDWDTLRHHIQTYGVRNSLLTALMPTASTSILLNNNECFEPYTSNVYRRKTLSGEFIVINKWLINDLYRLGLWNKKLKEYILACEGSIQQIDGIPDNIKALYKTAYEINQEELIQQAIDRQPFVDQSQSLNWYMKKVTLKEFTKLAFKAWRGRLKTFKYYTHSEPAAVAQKFSVDPALQKKMYEALQQDKKYQSNLLNKKEDEDDKICDLCSS